MIRFLVDTYRKLRHLVGYPVPFKKIVLEDMPSKMDYETLYLIGEIGTYWFAAMQCPCGCKANIQLSLIPDDNPKWSATEHLNGTVSLHPSVWRKIDCKSHYWFKYGLVRWCN